jgi:methyl-accepting chemotaxis protein
MSAANTPDLLQDMIQDVQVALDGATALVRTDLERARAIARDAADRLDRSFRALESAAASQRELVLSVVSRVYTQSGESPRLGAATEALLRLCVDEVARVSSECAAVTAHLGRFGEQIDKLAGCAVGLDGRPRDERAEPRSGLDEMRSTANAERTFALVASEVKRLASESAALADRLRLVVCDYRLELDGVDAAAAGSGARDGVRDLQAVLTDSVSKLEGGSSKLSELLQRLDTSVQEAVQALQFEDMVTQILDATVIRVELMNSLSIRALRAMHPANLAACREPMTEIREGISALAAASPVQQSSLERGDVELF